MISAPLPMRLGDLLRSAGVQIAGVDGDPGVRIHGISTHAQRTGRGEMFVAISGTSFDSHVLLSEAVDAGASVLLVEKESRPYPGVVTVRVPNTRAVLGKLAHALYGHPSRNMKVCGITGTNGKTTTTHLVREIMEQGGIKTAMIGTLGAYFGKVSMPTKNTTPDALELAEMMFVMEQEGVQAVAMEASSHAIDQGRLNGLRFRSCALTNLTQDHLDYHGTLANYAACKMRLFTDYLANSPGGQGCVNADDAVGRQLMETYTGDMISFSPSGDERAFVRGADVQHTPRGIHFTLLIGGRTAPVRSTLMGSFNFANMLTAAGCAHSMGMDVESIADALGKTRSVPGRFEYVDEGQPFSVIVDYAHTPDALERVLKTARRLCAGRLISVFGCGGDRDRGKRPIMGKAAGEASDFVIVTSDNPRTEDPQFIADQIAEGLRKSPLKANRFHMVLDRHRAIDQAINMACPGDVVLIAGKGHEDYQDFGTHRTHFDDREVAREVLRQIIGNFSQSPILEVPKEQHT